MCWEIIQLSQRWHEPKCIIGHGFENKIGRQILGLSPRKNPQDWVRDWMAITAEAGGVKSSLR